MDTDIFDAVFWSFFITSMVGLLLKCASMGYKSKCKEISFCCIKIVRDVDLEEREAEFLATHPPTPSIKKEEGEEKV